MMILTVNAEIEKAIITELGGYKRICGRIKVLERQSVGMGYTVNRMGEDKLQELHNSLRGVPSHMYLSPREQELEITAYAHLRRYPSGIASQHREVAKHHGVDSEDRDNLKDLTRRVQKVREARSMPQDNYSEVDDKLTELKSLMEERDRISGILEAVGDVRIEFSTILVLRYMDYKNVDEVADALNVHRKTVGRMEDKALEEYAAISGMSQTCLKNVP